MSYEPLTFHICNHKSNEHSTNSHTNPYAKTVRLKIEIEFHKAIWMSHTCTSVPPLVALDIFMIDSAWLLEDSDRFPKQMWSTCLEFRVLIFYFLTLHLFSLSVTFARIRFNSYPMKLSWWDFSLPPIPNYSNSLKDIVANFSNQPNFFQTKYLSPAQPRMNSYADRVEERLKTRSASIEYTDTIFGRIQVWNRCIVWWMVDDRLGMKKNS
jgi:hypothetical protein